MHGQAVRLVQGHDQVVAVQHQALQVARGALIDRLGGGRKRRAIRQGRDAHGLAGLQMGRGLDALAVDADLPGAAELFERALGEAREVTAQPAVEADVGLVGGDFAGGDGHEGTAREGQGSALDPLGPEAPDPR